MSDETQKPVKQNPGGYVGKDPEELVTKFTDDGIEVVSQPKKSKTESTEQTPDKANVSRG